MCGGDLWAGFSTHYFIFFCKQITQRAGVRGQLDSTARPIEYPRGPPLPLPPVEKKVAQIRGLEGKNIEEVVLPYIDDSDSEEEVD